MNATPRTRATVAIVVRLDASDAWSITDAVREITDQITHRVLRNGARVGNVNAAVTQ